MAECQTDLHRHRISATSRRGAVVRYYFVTPVVRLAFETCGRADVRVLPSCRAQLSPALRFCRHLTAFLLSSRPGRSHRGDKAGAPQSSSCPTCRAAPTTEPARSTTRTEIHDVCRTV
jgi:hypothetical protein